MNDAANGTLLDLFNEAVRDYADQPAARDDEVAVSYAELDRRSDVLADVLADRGVGRHDRAAIYLEHGVDVFVAMLGILKAGAAYVAVDLRYPDARRDLMIRHSGAAVVVTSPSRVDRVSGLDLPVLPFRSSDGPAPTTPRRVPVTPGDLACVLFTSGSTGVPKAIMLDHRNLVHLARNPVLAPLDPADRVGQVASLSFDTFHVESWCTFAQGAEVVVLPSMADLVANDLDRQLRERGITVLVAPTMAVNHVVHEDPDAFSSLRVLYTGGDVLQPAAARALLASRFRGDFYNLYGPTEATTCCTSHHVVEVSAGCPSIPIGQELVGATVHILDRSGAPVVGQAIGELHIGGVGVTVGYLGQPALTAARFQPDPFGPAGSRMYATGDRAWRHPDGVLEFAGRLDEQVKIRGYRVEPREAEQVIARHPDVRDAVVIVTGEAHDKRLVALVVLQDSASVDNVRAFAFQAMPDYLVPSAFIPVAEIPANHHGKRDGEKLRELAQSSLAGAGGLVEPRDEVDRYLANLWRELLAVPRIGTHDDFFALGGNSMLAFRARSRIERDLGVSIGAREILETARFSGLAKLVRSRQPAGVTA